MTDFPLDPAERHASVAKSDPATDLFRQSDDLSILIALFVLVGIVLLTLRWLG